MPITLQIHEKNLCNALVIFKILIWTAPGKLFSYIYFE